MSYSTWGAITFGKVYTIYGSSDEDTHIDNYENREKKKVAIVAQDDDEEKYDDPWFTMELKDVEKEQEGMRKFKRAIREKGNTKVEDIRKMFANRERRIEWEHRVNGLVLRDDYDLYGGGCVKSIARIEREIKRDTKKILSSKSIGVDEYTLKYGVGWETKREQAMVLRILLNDFPKKYYKDRIDPLKFRALHKDNIRKAQRDLMRFYDEGMAPRLEFQLFNACIFGNTDEVKALIKEGVDVNFVNKKTGDTALMYACDYGHKGVVEVLIGAKANIDYENKERYHTPLSLVCLHEYEDIVKLLIKADVNINYMDKNSLNTPLSRALFRGNENIITLLLDAGAYTMSSSK